jgi:hypothetical protein
LLQQLVLFASKIEANCWETACWPAACDAVRDVWNSSLLLAAANAASDNSDAWQFNTAWICEPSLSAGVSAWQCVCDAIGVCASKQA